MVSDIVCSGARQKIAATSGGTIATEATAIHHGRDETPSATAEKQMAIAQAAKSKVFVFVDCMDSSVGTGRACRCSQLNRALLYTS